jgi:hypothetical protein
LYAFSLLLLSADGYFFFEKLEKHQPTKAPTQAPTGPATDPTTAPTVVADRTLSFLLEVDWKFGISDGLKLGISAADSKFVILAVIYCILKEVLIFSSRSSHLF